MYAVVGIWTMDPAQRQRQDAILRERIVPGVARSEGFIRGVWSREVEGDRHTSFITFADEQSARSFAEVVRSNAVAQSEAGVSNDDLFVVEVIEQA